MTLQIALTGIDGIVLAGDQQINANPHSERGCTYTYMHTKFVLSEDRKRIASWAFDEKPASKLAKIAVSIGHEELQRNPHILEEKAKEVFEQSLEWRMASGQVILIDTAKCSTIEYVEYMGGNVGIHPPTKGKVIAGSRTNPAVAIVELFHRIEMPVEELVPLAAHAIVTAGIYDSTRIQGLEIARCTSKGVEIAREEEINELVARSKKLHGQTLRKIISLRSKRKNPLLDDELDWTEKDLDKLHREDKKSGES